MRRAVPVLMALLALACARSEGPVATEGAVDRVSRDAPTGNDGSVRKAATSILRPPPPSAPVGPCEAMRPPYLAQLHAAQRELHDGQVAQAMVRLRELEARCPAATEPHRLVSLIFWNEAVEELQSGRPHEALYYLESLRLRDSEDGDVVTPLALAKRYASGQPYDAADADAVSRLARREPPTPPAP